MLKNPAFGLGYLFLFIIKGCTIMKFSQYRSWYKALSLMSVTLAVSRNAILLYLSILTVVKTPDLNAFSSLLFFLPYIS